METVTLALGSLAALMTSLSYLPQAKKALPRGATQDLSLKTLLLLFAGLTFWVVYGILKGDLVVIAANVVGALLAGIVLGCKLRDVRSGDT